MQQRQSLSPCIMYSSSAIDVVRAFLQVCLVTLTIFVVDKSTRTLAVQGLYLNITSINNSLYHKTHFKLGKWNSKKWCMRSRGKCLETGSHKYRKLMKLRSLHLRQYSHFLPQLCCCPCVATAGNRCAKCV